MSSELTKVLVENNLWAAIVSVDICMSVVYGAEEWGQGEGWKKGMHGDLLT